MIPIASNTRRASSPPTANMSWRCVAESATRPPSDPCTTRKACGATVPHDGIPITVGLLLRVGRDQERELLIVRKHRPAVDPATRDAYDRELHGQHITRLATRIVHRRRVRCEPETDRVLWLHAHVLIVIDRRGLSGPLIAESPAIPLTDNSLAVLEVSRAGLSAVTLPAGSEDLMGC